MNEDFATAPVRDHMIPSPPVVTPATTVAAALRLLREHRLPALPICEGGRIRGLVDERALLRLTPSEATTLDVYEFRDALDRLTLALASIVPVPAVAPDMPLGEATRLLLRSERAALPVVEGTALAGLLTQTALLAAALGAPRHAARIEPALLVVAGPPLPAPGRRRRPDLDRPRPPCQNGNWSRRGRGRGYPMKYNGQEHYDIEVAGLRRRLPIVRITDGLWIAAFVLWGDVELTNACARAIAARLQPMVFDHVVSIEAKALPLVHMVATYLSDPLNGRYRSYVVLRKSVKGYMKDPLTVAVKSITTAAAQSLVLDGAEAERLRGSRVVVVDDVVSTGGSLRACEELLERIGAQIVARATVLLEEGGYDDPSLISLGRLPIFTK